MITSTNNFKIVSEILESVLLYGFSTEENRRKQKAFLVKALANYTSDPGGIRTPNQQSRNLPFYPVELRSHIISVNITYFCTIIYFIFSYFIFNRIFKKCNSFTIIFCVMQCPNYLIIIPCF